MYTIPAYLTYYIVPQLKRKLKRLAISYQTTQLIFGQPVFFDSLLDGYDNHVMIR